MPNNISPPKHGLQHLWRLAYGLLMTERVDGSLACIKDISEVWNLRVAKSSIVLILNLQLLHLVKKVIPLQLNQHSRYCCINITNKLYLLASSVFLFGWKTINRTTNYMLYTNEFERKQYSHHLRHFLLVYTCSHPISYRISVFLREGPFVSGIEKRGHFALECIFLYSPN